MKKTFILCFINLIFFSFFSNPIFSQTQIGSTIFGEERHSLGTSVSISGDGMRIAAMSPGYIDTLTNPYTFHDGHVKIYEWQNEDWVLLKTINKSHTYDFGGRQIALSKDGTHIILGTPHFDHPNPNVNAHGRVRVFSEQDDGSWSIKGTHILGTGDDHIDYGRSVALSADGNAFAATAPWQGDDGMIEVREWNGTDWVIKGAPIVGDNPYSVTMSNNGNRIASGGLYTDNPDSISTGHVKVHAWNGSEWVQLGNTLYGETLGSLFGKVVSFSGSGLRLAVGAPHLDGINNQVTGPAGGVYVFEWENGSWQQLGQTLQGDAPDNLFGYSVSLSGDGNRLVVGAPYNDGNGAASGQVKIFDWMDNQWIQVGGDIHGNESENMGVSVAIAADGSSVISSSFMDNNNVDEVGIIKVYDISALTSISFLEEFPMEIFPNPTQGEIQIQGEPLDELRIIDARGRVMETIQNPNSIIDIAHLPNGIYFLQGQKNEQVVNRKIIKNGF